METNKLVELIRESLEKPANYGSYQGVRKLSKGRPNKRIIRFYSRKNGAHIPCESRLEAAHALMMEFDGGVKRYRSQPLKLKTTNTHYVPDFVMETPHKLYELHEIKPKAKFEKPRIKQRLAEIKTHIESEGVEFKKFNETSLAKQPQKHNREYLYRYTRCEVSDVAICRAKQYLQGLEWPIALGQLRDILQEQFKQRELADELIMLSFLTFDTRFYLSVNTPIYLSGETK